jgi:hypothetical protein
MHASQIALRSYEQEKLNALRNAIQHVAKGESPETTWVHLYLELVDTLTIAHLMISQVLRSLPKEALPDPKSPPTSLPRSLAVLVEEAMPDLVGEKQLASQLFQQLVTQGLVLESGRYNSMKNPHQEHLINFGQRFLDFISGPGSRH